MRYVIDAYSWIDYIDGNSAGQKIKEYIENPNNEIITNILNIAEISSFLGRKNSKQDEIDEAFNIIFSISKIYNFNAEFSKNAGLLHSEIRKKQKDFGLIDAFILLTAKRVKARILTGDEHFRKFKNVILIK